MSLTGTLVEQVGWLGAGVLILGYGLVSYGHARSSGAIFQLLNLLGSVFLVINTDWHGAWPSCALNVAWAVMALGVLVRITWMECQDHLWRSAA